MIKNDNQKYDELGKKAKETIIKIIEEEGIMLKKSYQASFDSCFSYVRRITRHSSDEVHMIIMPKLTDYTDLQQAIFLAHELGHYHIHKKAKTNWERKLLNSKNPYLLYRHEKLAWEFAGKLLQELGIIKKDSRILRDYLTIKEKSLKTYKPKESLLFYLLKPIVKFGFKLFYYWIVAYFIVGFIYLLIYNGLPVPLLFDPNKDSLPKVSDFYRNVYSVWFIIVSSYICLSIIKKLI